tara:strand:+ start:215 stop:436 length:222 start_codon:yes stop_codon:yes gene_type:complete
MKQIKKNLIKIIAEAEYAMCGCNQLEPGIASVVTENICPSGYRCYWPPPVKSDEAWGQCIPEGMKQGPKLVCV